MHESTSYVSLNRIKKSNIWMSMVRLVLMVGVSARERYMKFLSFLAKLIKRWKECFGISESLIQTSYKLRECLKGFEI